MEMGWLSWLVSDGFNHVLLSRQFADLGNLPVLKKGAGLYTFIPVQNTKRLQILGLDAQYPHFAQIQ